VGRRYRQQLPKGWDHMSVSTAENRAIWDPLSSHLCTLLGLSGKCQQTELLGIGLSALQFTGLMEIWYYRFSICKNIPK
jgi:hypothetical protein